MQADLQTLRDYKRVPDVKDRERVKHAIARMRARTLTWRERAQVRAIDPDILGKYAGRNLSFVVKLDLFSEFVKAHGRAPVRDDVFYGHNIGKLQDTLRMKYRKYINAEHDGNPLTAQRVAEINAIHKDILHPRTTTRMQKITALGDFITQNHRMPDTSEPQLLTWLRALRKRNDENRLTASEISACNAAHIRILRTQSVDITARITALRDYISQHGMPRHDTVWQGNKVYYWIASLRRKHERNALSAEHVKQLNALHENILNPNKCPSFDARCEILREYIAHNEFPKRGTTYRGYRIHTWINNFRILYKKCLLGTSHVLTPENISALNAIDERILVPANTNAVFRERLQIVQAFVRTFSRPPKPRELYSRKPIGRWVVQWQQDYAKFMRGERARITLGMIKRINAVSARLLAQN